MVKGNITHFQALDVTSVLSVEVIISEVDQSGRLPRLPEDFVLIVTNIHPPEIVYLHRRGSERAQANPALPASPEAVPLPTAERPQGPGKSISQGNPENPEFPSLPPRDPPENECLTGLRRLKTWLSRHRLTSKLYKHGGKPGRTG